jgi:hypothetical protein
MGVTFMLTLFNNQLIHIILEILFSMCKLGTEI